MPIPRAPVVQAAGRHAISIRPLRRSWPRNEPYAALLADMDTAAFRARDYRLRRSKRRPGGAFIVNHVIGQCAARAYRT
jgi:hypothetical protein